MNQSIPSLRQCQTSPQPLTSMTSMTTANQIKTHFVLKTQKSLDRDLRSSGRRISRIEIPVEFDRKLYHGLP